MKVISYIATLPSKLLQSNDLSSQKINTLRHFVNGVNAVGDVGLVVDRMIWEPCDVAVMLGWVHEHGKNAPHLSFRQEILERQRNNGGRTVIADSNLFLYKNKSNPHYYLRYSFDGVFPNTGEYCDSAPDPSRWQRISKDIGVHPRNWRNNGTHLLMCLQRDGGWSMADFRVYDWATQTIMKLRNLTDRPIKIRAHPGDKKAYRYVNQIIDFCKANNLKNVESSSTANELTHDLKNCWAVINHNSSPAVAAAIEGIPVFVTDPVRSQAKEVANTDLSRIEQPQMFDRESWLHRLSQFHWSHLDISDGSCWSHMRKWAQR